MIFTVLALDPGGTSGWATYQAEHVYEDPKRSAGFYSEKWNCGLLEGDAHHNELFALLELSQTQEFHVVCESFEYRNQSRAGLELVSKEYIGVVNLFAQQRNIVDHVHYQTASQGKVTQNSFIQKRNLQTAGLWSPVHEDRHAMDGYGHLLYWLVNGQYRRYDLLRWLGK